MDRVARVVPAAEIDDATVDDLAQQISQVFASGATTVAVDVEAVTFCDSSGLRVLTHAATLARAAGATLLVVNPTRSLLRLADILQAFELLNLPRAP